MDLLDHDQLSDWKSKYQKKFQQLSRPLKRSLQAHRDPEKKILLRRRYLGILALLSSVLLGKHSYDLAYQQSIEDWKIAHIPSIGLWTLALKSRGWTSIEDPAFLHRLVKNLPPVVNSFQNVFMDSNERWVAIFQPNETMDPPNVFGPFDLTDDVLRLLKASRTIRRTSSGVRISKDIKPFLPEEWIEAGQGWDAFYAVTERFDSRYPGGMDYRQLLKEFIRAPSPKKSPSFNPHEIRY